MVPQANGRLKRAPMKDYLRENPQYMPEGMTRASIRHVGSPTVAKKLEKLGWIILETETEVRLYIPGTKPSTITDEALVD